MKIQNIFKHRERQEGFTLIELLVVIAIISLLSSIVFASLSSARVKARDARRLSDIHQLVIALNLYASDNNGKYPIAGTFYCLGHTTATSCGNEQYTGNDALNAMIQPYIPVIPDDPKAHGHNPSTCWGDSYQYSSTPDGSGPLYIGTMKMHRLPQPLPVFLARTVV